MAKQRDKVFPERDAIVAFIQNPGQPGNVLQLAGTNAEGTEAAGKFATDVELLSSTLRKYGIDPNGPTRHYPSMQIETEATRYLQRAARAAREASRVLAGTSENRRNSALRMMATSLRDRRVDPVIMEALRALSEDA